MIYVLLTDNDNETFLVACPDEATADQVGAAAIYNDGGVSAWRVPPRAVTNTYDVARILNEGGSCRDLRDADLPDGWSWLDGVPAGDAQGSQPIVTHVAEPTTPLTQVEFEGDDFPKAKAIARRLGYEQYAYTSTSALWGLFCLPENPAYARRGQRTEGGCIIKTRELGFLFVQHAEDLRLGVDFENVQVFEEDDEEEDPSDE